MKKTLLFFGILLVVSLSFCFVGMIFLDWKIRSIFGFQFFSFAVAGSFIYFLEKYFRIIDTLFFLLFFSVFSTLYLVRTEITIQIGGFFNIFLYSLFLYSPLAVVMKYFGKHRLPKYVKNIIFSLIMTIVYTLIHLAVYVLLKETITFEILKMYFYNYLIIFLIISFAFTFSELLFRNIVNFFTPPEIKR